MRIQGLPLSDGGLQRIESTKTEKAAAEKTRKSDVVELSQSALEGDNEVNTQNAMTIEFPERAERISAVTQNIADRTYDQPDVQVAIAEKILQNDTVIGVVTDQSNSVEVRDDEISRVNDMVAQDYYAQPDVVEQIAGSLIDALGFSGMF